MMSAGAHAIGLIALIVATVALGYVGWREPLTARRVVWALVGALLLVFVAGGLGSHLCLRGSAVMQPLIGALCLAITILCVTHPRLRLGWAAILVVVTCVMSYQYAELVHRHDLVGTPDYDDREARRRASLRERVAEDLAQRPAPADGHLPRGWVRDLRLPTPARGLPGGEARPTRAEVGSFWHSGFTRIYPLKETPVDLWYPGGRWEDGLKALEWRDRPR